MIFIQGEQDQLMPRVRNLRPQARDRALARAGALVVMAIALAAGLCAAAPTTTPTTAPAALLWREIKGVKNVERVWPSPVDPSKVFVWARSGLLISSDDGRTFELSGDAKTVQQLGRITDMLINPVTPKVLYAGTQAKGIFRSEDEGKTWTAMGGEQQGLANMCIHSLVFSPDDPTFTTIFATHSLEHPGISVTIDGGKTWRSFASQYCVSDLTLMGGNTMFFSGKRTGQNVDEDGFYRTTDGGKMFVRMLNARGPTALAGSHIVPSVAWAGTSSGPLYHTNDWGLSIAPRQIIDEPMNIASISLGFADPYHEVIHVYDPKRGVFSSLDGKTWSNNSDGLGVNDWVADGANMAPSVSGESLYACINGAFYRGTVRPSAAVMGSVRAEPGAVEVGDPRPVTFTCQAAKGAEVSLDLSPIGGPMLPMHDDGQDGDATAGDGIYSVRWAVPLDAAVPAELPKGVTDLSSGKSHHLPGQIVLRVTAKVADKSQTGLVPLLVMPDVQDRILWNGDDRNAWCDVNWAHGLGVARAAEKPLSGTGHLRLRIQGPGIAGFGWHADHNATDDTRAYKFLSFYIRSETDGPTDLKLSMRDANWDGYRTNDLDLSSYLPKVTTRYQFVAIPMADFVLGSEADPKRLRELIFIAPAGAGARVYDLDDIGLKVQYGPNVSAAMAVLQPDGASVKLSLRADSMQGKSATVVANVGEKAIPLLDDGQHGDGAAGDGTFAAVVPVGDVGTGARTLRFSASDANGSTERRVSAFLPRRPPGYIARARTEPPCNGSGAGFESVAPFTITADRYAMNARLMYGRDHLCFSIDVKDPGFVPARFPNNQVNSAGLLQGACVEIMITSPTAFMTLARDKTIQQDHRIVLGMVDRQGFGFLGSHAFNSAAKVTDDGYRLEGRINFADFNLPNNQNCDFELGKTTRIEFRLNTSRRTQYTWASADSKAAANPDNWGLARFGDDIGPAQVSFVQCGGNVLTLLANKSLDAASAQNPATYQVAGVQVTKAELGMDGQTVKLTAAAPWPVTTKIALKLAGLKGADGSIANSETPITLYPGQVLAGHPFAEYLLSPVQKDVDMTSALQQDLIGEKTVRPAAGSKGWELVSEATGVLNFAQTFGELENAAIHAHVYVWSDADRKAQLWVGSDDGLKVVLNGAVVMSKSEVRQIEPDKDRITVQLKQGWNMLLFTVPTVSAGWALCARLMNERGEPPVGVSYQANSPFGTETVGMAMVQVQARKVAEACTAGVNVEIAGAMGWLDTWKISNKSCELIVVPQISRAMKFGPKGGINVLWVNGGTRGRIVPQDNGEWNNMGGDKVWPAPWNLWDLATGNWRPNYYFDCCVSTAEPIKGGVRLRSPTSPRFGAACIREFVMDETRPLVYIRQYLQKTDGAPVEIGIWHATQVAKPDFALAAMGPLESGKGYVGLFDAPASRLKALTTCISIEPDEASTQKVGIKPMTDGSNGWVAAVWEKTMLVASHKVEKDGKYPEPGCHFALFTAAVNLDMYFQLEVFSPLANLQKGQKLQSDEVWQLVTVDAAQLRDREKVASAAREAHKVALDLLAKP